MRSEKMDFILGAKSASIFAPRITTHLFQELQRENVSSGSECCVPSVGGSGAVRTASVLRNLGISVVRNVWMRIASWTGNPTSASRKQYSSTTEVSCVLDADSMTSGVSASIILRMTVRSTDAHCKSSSDKRNSLLVERSIAGSSALVFQRDFRCFV